MPSLQVRNLSDSALSRFREGAYLRGISQAQYLEALLELHQLARELALDDSDMKAALDQLGLQAVSRSV